MKTTTEILNILRNYKANAPKEYGILRIGIFGSVARQEQKDDSDVDVCVELSRPRLFTLVHIKEELQELFNCPVDITMLREHMDLRFKQNILRDSIYA